MELMPVTEMNQSEKQSLLRSEIKHKEAKLRP